VGQLLHEHCIPAGLALANLSNLREILPRVVSVAAWHLEAVICSDFAYLQFAGRYASPGVEVIQVHEISARLSDRQVLPSRRSLRSRFSSFSSLLPMLGSFNAAV